ncbi:dihydrofolate reductase family protein [Vibrio sp. TMPB1044]|uniref:dihydrofolate reductase family protein n=1 Tax=Vibrio sp. TMPB1044 TaxID=3051822 RepID=UPI00255B45A8|nr:dihydrofolate reductase family protein [Vibrio sp. TMPB1044]MDL5027717.1 dihydrofolate reductase family protein [Vibrio sp. TMPB1044]MDN5207845.1 dihydrofolate reductase family protein [Vibrio sp. TMPB1044]
MSNIVFIGASLDGYIADKKGSLDWLQAIPNPEGDDMGYNAHIDRIDALVMGRNTMDMVLSFGIDWPYTKPVYVLSNTLNEVPQELEGKVFLMKGELKQIVADLNNKGLKNLYIDGGITIQNFMKEDLIDELIISTIPVVLGGGSPLFGDLVSPLDFTLKSVTTYLDEIVTTHYLRKR